MTVVYQNQNGYLIKKIEECRQNEQEDVFFMLTRRLEHYKKQFVEKPDNVISINNCFRQEQKKFVCFFGLIYSFAKTKNGHIMLEIEDETGVVRVLVNKTNVFFKKAQELTLDTCVAIKGTRGDGVVFLHTLYTPQILSPKKQKNINEKILFLVAPYDKKKIQEYVKQHNIKHIVCFGKNNEGAVLCIPDEKRKELPQQPFNDKNLTNPTTVITHKGVKFFLYSNDNNKPCIKDIVATGHTSPVYGKHSFVPQEEELLYVDSDVDIVFVKGPRDEVFYINGTLCVQTNTNCIIDLMTYKVTNI